jgi:hypothetical protein
MESGSVISLQSDKKGNNLDAGKNYSSADSDFKVKLLNFRDPDQIINIYGSSIVSLRLNECIFFILRFYLK